MEILEKIKNNLLTIGAAICGIAVIGSLFFNLPGYIALSALVIFILLLVVFIWTHENISNFPLVMRFLFTFVIVMGGVSAIFVFGLATNILPPLEDFIKLGIVGIDIYTVLLAVSGVISICGFFLLKMYAKKYGYE